MISTTQDYLKKMCWITSEAFHVVIFKNNYCQLKSGLLFFMTTRNNVDKAIFELQTVL